MGRPSAVSSVEVVSSHRALQAAAGATTAHLAVITKPNVPLRQATEGEVDNFEGLSLSAEAGILEKLGTGPAAARQKTEP